jgi:ubiquinone/menaquinone biosynthesis C-methylase UbiE
MAASLEQSVADYRGLASRYDHSTRRIDRVRERAIAALGRVAGQVVLDAGCGTGWCLDRLASSAGPRGRVIGFDPSQEMLAIARGRAASAGGAPVELIHAAAQDVRLPVPAEAILFSYTHDVMRSRAALENLLRQAIPGARVAATGTKLYASWLFPANWYLRRSHRGYVTDFAGFEAPWSLLAEYLDDFHVRTGPLTQHYVATGSVRALR